MATAYNFYLFGRDGACLHYREWSRPRPVTEGAGTPADDRRQMFGLCWTLSNLTAALDPKNPDPPPLGAPRRIGQGARFHAFTTRAYKLHFLESPSGLRFVLTTSPDAGDLRDAVAAIYSDAYCGAAARNALIDPRAPFDLDSFDSALAGVLRARGLVLQQPQGQQQQQQQAA